MRPLRFLLFLLLSSVSLSSLALSPPINVKVESEWGGAVLADVQAVTDSVVTSIMPYVDLAHVEPILVRNEPAGPITFYKKGEQGQTVIALEVNGAYWSQIGLQFSHELCHVLSNYDLAPNNISKQMWVDETVCEAFSLFALKQMAEQWKTNPPYPNWKDYAPQLLAYREQRLQEPHRQLPTGMTYSQWYAQHKDELSANPEAEQRRLNEVVATKVLALFEANPENWNALRYLNLGDDRSDKSLNKFLSDWEHNTPEKWRAPITQLKAELLGSNGA